MENLYKQLSDDLLFYFYFEIKKNINNNILSPAMNLELKLIKEAAFERGTFILDKHKKTTY